MKHIKTYEELNIGKPQVGDYVIIETNFPDPRIIDFFKNNITQII